MWTNFEVELNFLTRLCASVPADEELIKKWLESRKPKNRRPDTKSIAEVAAEVLESMPEEADPSLLVFQRQEGGLVVRLATVRAHMKDCARILSKLYVGKLEKEMSFAQKVLNAVYHDPTVYWLPILKQDTNKQFTMPNGVLDKAVHAMTRMGPITALKSFEYVENARLRIPLKVLTSAGGRSAEGKPTPGRLVVSEDDLNHLFTYGGTHGYAGERSDGEGRYIASIRRLDS